MNSSRYHHHSGIVGYLCNVIIGMRDIVFKDGAVCFIEYIFLPVFKVIEVSVTNVSLLIPKQSLLCFGIVFMGEGFICGSP